MNTIEAIYFLEHEVKLFPHEAKSLPACLRIYKIAENIEEIIKLLKRGEKFEQVYGKLKDNFPYLRGELEVKEFIEEFEQKHFPKGGK